jgi:hypothetical protein
LQHFWSKQSKLVHAAAAATTTTFTLPHHASGHGDHKFDAMQQPTKKAATLQYK